MRILHVTDCYLPRLGGIEMHVSDLAARQTAAGHQVSVLTRTPPDTAYRDDASPIRVERLDCGPLALGAGRDILRYVEREHVDLLHAHLSVASPLASTALRGAHAYPSVATVHSVVPDSPDLLRAAAAWAGLPTESVTFTAVSEVAATPWRRAFGDRMPVLVLPNGIDPGAWAAPHVTAADADFVVVSVGRFARRKRPLALIPMLAALRRGLPQTRIRAVLVGDGPQLPKLRREVSRWGLDEVVELPGRLTRAQIKQVLQRADAYLAPAVLESFGIAALEARCAGVPVVAMAQGGAGEFIDDGREGFLVSGDAEMTEAMTRLARDPALRRHMREHNATTRPPVSWPEVLTLHDHVYALATANASTHRPAPAMARALEMATAGRHDPPVPVT